MSFEVLICYIFTKTSINENISHLSWIHYDSFFLLFLVEVFQSWLSAATSASFAAASCCSFRLASCSFGVGKGAAYKAKTRERTRACLRCAAQMEHRGAVGVRVQGRQRSYDQALLQVVVNCLR